jgi:hypothetical protein
MNGSEPPCSTEAEKEEDNHVLAKMGKEEKRPEKVNGDWPDR